MDSNDVYKQIEAIVYYPKKTRWSMLNIVYSKSALHNDKRIANDSEWWSFIA